MMKTTSLFPELESMLSVSPTVLLSPCTKQQQQPASHDKEQPHQWLCQAKEAFSGRVPINDHAYCRRVILQLTNFISRVARGKEGGWSARRPRWFKAGRTLTLLLLGRTGFQSPSLVDLGS